MEKIYINRMVSPGTLNNHDTLFGGLAVKWMDEAAFIAATKAIRKKMVTTEIRNCTFTHQVLPGSIVEIIAEAKEVNGLRLHVETSLFTESMEKGGKILAARADFYFVCLNDRNQPERIKHI